MTMPLQRNTYHDPWRQMEDMRSQMDRVFRGFLQPGANATSHPRPFSTRGPRFELADEGNQLVLRADLPGLSEDELRLDATPEALTVSGERKADSPEGYSLHRQERSELDFSRSFALPCRVDLETVTATLERGQLTVTLPKQTDAQPRAITVKAG